MKTLCTLLLSCLFMTLNKVTGELKVFYSSFSDAEMSCSRYWMERALEDAKTGWQRDSGSDIAKEENNREGDT